VRTDEGWLGDLEPPWRAALEMAWVSYQEGNTPIGAVVVDQLGQVIGSGRSQRLSLFDGSGRLAGTNIAHAELSALTCLPRGDYRDCTLYTTLRPCFVCATAVVQTRIGHVEFAGEDPVVDGIERLPEIAHQMARRWPSWNRPAAGPLRLLCEVLPLIFEYKYDQDGDLQAFETHSPGAAKIAQRLLADGRAQRLVTLPLADATRLVPELYSAITPVEHDFVVQVPPFA